ncbi:MAG: LapA family protein [Kiloniellales bacterium]|nr:LapA family protein [Kiloniellales bacterium]
MKFLAWFPRILITFIGVILAIVVVSFALSNRQRVTLDLWPFEIGVELPLFLMVLVSFVIGFLAGGCVMWLSGAAARRQAREARRKAARLERQTAELQQRAAGGKASDERLPMVANGN